MTDVIPRFKRATAAKNPGLESFDKTHSAEAATKLSVRRHGLEMMPFLKRKSRHSLNLRLGSLDIANLRLQRQIMLEYSEGSGKKPS